MYKKKLITFYFVTLIVQSIKSALLCSVTRIKGEYTCENSMSCQCLSSSLTLITQI